MILIGHVLNTLKTVQPNSVHCCVTSPPYWGLRAYGTDPQVWGGVAGCEHEFGDAIRAPWANAVSGPGSSGKNDAHWKQYGKTSGNSCQKCGAWRGEYGSEPTIEMYVEHTVEIFREVRRVLRDDGVLWLNLGDSYNQYNGNRGPAAGLNVSHNGSMPALPQGNGLTCGNLKAGDLCNIPNRVALALQADGWYWRQTVIWSKPAPMPESVNGWRWERCRLKVNGSARGRNKHAGGTGLKPHSERDGADFINTTEYVACPGCPKCSENPAECPMCGGDGDSQIGGRNVGKCIACDGSGRFGGYVLRRGSWRCTGSWEAVFMLTKSRDYFCDAEAIKEPTTGGAHSRGSGVNPKSAGGQQGMERQNAEWSRVVTDVVEKRNPRSVWTIPPFNYKEAHFATYPPMLPYRCIKASCSAGGCCSACGAQYAPIVEKERVATRPGNDSKVGRVSDDPESPYHGQSGMVVGNRDPQRHIQISRVLGYLPTCKCGAPVGKPRVLDPFGGSGTTAVVAEHLNCDWTLCELNPEYARLAEERIAAGWQPKTPKQKRRKKQKFAEVQRELFH